jgi:hypothetical protein
MRTGTLLFVAITAWGAEPSMDGLAIMRKMAANTDAATDARRQYVYHQRVRSSLRKSNGEVVCREAREYSVIPQATKTEKQLTSFSGACLEGKKMVHYSPPRGEHPGLREKATGQDHDDGPDERETIAGFIDDLASDSKSRDGIARPLFPLTAEEIAHYTYRLKGETTVKGRRAYDILFEPAGHNGVCIDVDEQDSEAHLHVDLGGEHRDQTGCRPWKGEAWIDAEDFQPVRIDTQLAKGVPWGVRVFLGTNVRQLGFSLTYQRVAPGVWFPATYGTEFRFTVLWGYKRTVTLSMDNTDFRKTDAQSTIQFESTEK